jgi:hypothetical protein
MSDETIDWQRIALALRIPYGWRLWPKRHGNGWKLTAAGADPMPCGHASMQVTADSLPLAVALMAGRRAFHRSEAQWAMTKHIGHFVDGRIVGCDDPKCTERGVEVRYEGESS